MKRAALPAAFVAAIAFLAIRSGVWTPALPVALGPPERPAWPGPLDPPIFPWLSGSAEPLHNRFPAPRGFERVPVEPGGFAEWLRCLPLEPGPGVILAHTGRPIREQGSHATVVRIDVGRRDLQQCADSVLRLRAEYLLGRGLEDELAFRFTSGDLSRWTEWREGVRPVVRGSSVAWERRAEPDRSYASFRAWLDSLFAYAGTRSLARDLTPVASWTRLEPGDVLVRAGSPGHAVLVVDLARRPDAGERAILIAQGFMPAQSLHVLAGDLPGGWFAVPAPGGTLEASGWEFGEADLRRF